MKTVSFDESEWKLVPVEITENMVGALVNASTVEGPAWEDATHEDKAECISIAETIYSAMLAAAPTSSEAPADVARDAERYRWLRKKICFNGNGDGTASMHAINLPNAARFPEYDKIEIGVDAAIDAAMSEKGGA